MANLLHLQLSSACVRRRDCSRNREIDLWRSIVSRGSFECHVSRGRFRFRAEEEELFHGGDFAGFEFGNSKKEKKKRPWWLDDDDDDYDDWRDDEDDWSLVFEILRNLSWMLAPIGISLLLGTDSNAGLMALAVPLVQSLLSLVVDKVLSRPSFRPMRRSRRESFSTFASVSNARTRKARREDAGVDKGGYKSWMVGDADDFSSRSSSYGGWDDLDNQKEIRNEEVHPNQQFKRKASRRRWRIKEKPLLLRMLIAAFPFMGSWTKLLF